MSTNCTLVFICLAVISGIISGCAGSYNQYFSQDSQLALIYLGHNSGNRVLFLNFDKLPQINIHRKTSADSAFTMVRNLKINKASLQYRVGNHGPGFAYDWNDPDDSGVTTRYKVVALDDSSNFLVELKSIHSVRDDSGEWKLIEEDM
jgi:hypothetical protein